jgi:TonB family protein
MVARAAIRPDEKLNRFVTYSILLHCALVATVVVSTLTSHSGENWGAPGGSVTVGLVGNVPAIPLPHPTEETPSQVVDNSKGLFKSEPKPLPKPEVDAVPIPKFEKNKPPKYAARPNKPETPVPPPPKYDSRPSNVLKNPVPPPPNAIPYGQGGAPTVPTSSFVLGNTGATEAGMSFGGPSTGNFGARFPWYVTAVRDRISSNWLQSTIDPSVGYAPRVVVTFTILRDGTATNIQITQSSNDYSVDSSAIRAVKNSSPLTPLPSAYSGSAVNVEFWFDFHR